MPAIDDRGANPGTTANDESFLVPVEATRLDGNQQAAGQTETPTEATDRNQAQGDLLRNLGPLVAVDLTRVMGGAGRENPGLRRVEVAGQGVGETGRGTMVGPVMGGPPLTMPQGVPTVYGPAGYPTHLENPGFVQAPPQGWMEQGFAQMNTSMRQPAIMEGNPFWSPEARSFLCGTLEGNRNPNRALDPSQTDTEARPGLGDTVHDGLNRIMAAVGERLFPGGNPLGWFRGQAQNGNPGSPEVEMDPIELFRIRCLREAEQKFAQGIEQMQGRQQPQKPDGNSGRE